MLKIAIFSNSNSNIGEGHNIRCLRLALYMIEKEVEIIWLAFELTKRVTSEINKNNIQTKILKKLEDISEIDVDVLICDGYELDLCSIKRLLKKEIKLVYFDDLAKKKLPVDILIDSNPVQDNDAYDSLIPVSCIKLIGSEYLIFLDKALDKVIPKDERLIHIFFGSTDNKGLTSQYLKKLIKLLPNYKFNVVVTEETKNLNKVKAIANFNHNVRLFFEPSDLYESMKFCKYAIGGPGTTTWERLLLRCRCLLMSTVENQHAILQKLDSNGLIDYIGRADDVGIMAMKISKLVKFNQVKPFLHNFDGQGKARIYGVIKGLMNENS